jgi:hypothetical protein
VPDASGRHPTGQLATAPQPRSDVYDQGRCEEATGRIKDAARRQRACGRARKLGRLAGTVGDRRTTAASCLRVRRQMATKCTACPEDMAAESCAVARRARRRFANLATMKFERCTAPQTLRCRCFEHDTASQILFADVLCTTPLRKPCAGGATCTKRRNPIVPVAVAPVSLPPTRFARAQRQQAQISSGGVSAYGTNVTPSPWPDGRAAARAICPFEWTPFPLTRSRDVRIHAV